MLNWCCCCYPDEYEEIPTQIEREVNAILLGISNEGYITIQLPTNRVQKVRLFDFGISTLYPNQIHTLNKRYTNQTIIVKWMDAASFLSSSILLIENTPRLCQIITLDGTLFTDCIKAYLLE